MKFPGQRKSKHYFPVNSRDPLLAQLHPRPKHGATYIAGIDQILVDIEAKVSDELLQRYALPEGNSTLIDDARAHALYTELNESNMISDEFAGGTIGNTLHNYSVLADDKSVLFGAMSKNIEVGSYSYRYLCDTSSKVDLNYLQPVMGAVGRCFTLISESGERTFAISKGVMDQLSTQYINKEVIQGASALILTAYLMRTNKGDTITQATLKAIEYAKEANVPVVLTLGTRFLIEQDPTWWKNFIKENVTILAMNEDEGEALTGFPDPLLASQAALDLCDMVLTTAGPLGLYTAGYTEESQKRETTHPLLPGQIPEFNRYEFSRPKLKSVCENPLKVYAHISPYMGGPEKISNTNGAGDAALAALLHDLASNSFHKQNVPGSSKHLNNGICYSSFSQICKYANRVAYEVLAQHSPRLSRGLPEREDSLEESYWER
ncbi:inosine/guanosine kinase [Psychromonas sp. CNPT3]|uniref:inosine/guanosine kinase n=1 Tax=Psychromonas sp. CNPT3 TaxID=314282 RepID=UPI00006E4259|nr:inosine/guanosine kinase [Psychromonas sp. CNPT3]AGH81085.1 inosine/guanosine kinase [Psychromonas sp. CNPT3]